MASPTDLGLLDAIKSGGFEASVITTFNAYLPFYEDVVLPKLRSAGSRHNVVLMDATECAKALAQPECAPRFAGRAYTLIPIHNKCAFHPKIFLAAGRSKGVLHVGSHNLTLSGFGQNNEVTGLVRANPKEASEAALLSKAWQAIQQWVRREENQLPGDVLTALQAVERLVPWLGKTKTEETGAELLIQADSGEALWSQFRPKLPRRPRAAVVIGAFFDAKLSFLEAFAAALPKISVRVVIDPRTVALACDTRATSAYDWCDGVTLPPRAGYLHAKALWITGSDDDDVLFVGSANPSAPAWLGSAQSRNDEAMLLLTGKPARQAAERLGLQAIAELPSIGNKALREIVGRVPPIETQRLDRTHAPFVAALSGGELTLSWEVFDVLPSAARFVDRDGNVFGETTNVRVAGSRLVIPVPASQSGSLVRLQLALPSGGQVTAIVHHSAEIADLCRTGTQQALRVALERLGDDANDISQLVSLVERAIFFGDEGPSSESAGLRASKSAKRADVEAPRPESLVVDLKDMKKLRSRKRLLEQGSDLAYLLDVLFRELKTESGAEQEVDAHGRSEEEQVNKDDEEPAADRKPGDDAALSKLCRSKVRRLVGRMVAYLEAAGAVDEPARWLDAVVKLLAVMAVLRELRVIEQLPRWRSIHEALVDEDAKEDLLEGIFPVLFGRKYAILARANEELGKAAYEELARLKGLLLWLAWDCRVRLESRYSVMDDPSVLGRKLWDKAALLEIAQYLPGDDLALQEAHRSVMRCTTAVQRMSASAWVSEVTDWCRRVEAAAVDPSSAARATELRVGGLAYVSSKNELRLRVVSECSGDSIALKDLSEDSGKVRFQRDRVVAMSLA